MAGPNISQRRAENLKAMRSPASLALAFGGLVAMICAMVFYDKPISGGPVSFSQLQVAWHDTMHWTGQSWLMSVRR
jgi:hypothetical protein